MANSGSDLSVAGFSPSRRLVAAFCVVLAIAGGAGLAKGLTTPFVNPWREPDRILAKSARQPAVPTATALSSSAALGAFLVVPVPKPEPAAVATDEAAIEAEAENDPEGLAAPDTPVAAAPSAAEDPNEPAKPVPVSTGEAVSAPVEPPAAADSAVPPETRLQGEESGRTSST